MANWFKRNSIHFAILGIFVVICFVYFSPAIQGKVLPQHDVQQAQGTQKEIMDFRAKDGKGPLWTNSMFGGMPAYQIWLKYPNNVASYVIDFFSTVFPSPMYFVLISLIGAYILFSVLKVNPWLAFGGSLAFAFTSYNIILLQAGHNNQALAIGFFAPILAGIILTFRKNYITGAALTAAALAIEVRSNHIQMTYYLFIVLLIYAGIELYHAIKAKTLPDYLKSIGYLAAATILAVGVNAGSLWTTYEYGELSQRGKSNLTLDKKDASTGLTRDYAYAWSQGVGENITFLIPNAYGGASGNPIPDDSEVSKVLIAKGVPAEQANGFAKQMPSYWGEKTITSGPFYFGAVVFFLFVLGLLIVSNRLKWWILAAVTLCLFLSFGRNFPFVSDLFFNYFPMYNKFRTVESVLAIAGLLFPVLAILAVNELISSKTDPKKLVKKLLYAFYITGGLILLVILVPTLLFSFKNSGHEEFIKNLSQATGGDMNFADAIANALIEDRISLARSDAFRSLLFVLIAAGLTWALIKSKINAVVASVLFAIAILVDLWNVDRRYLNNDSFVEETQLSQQSQQRDVDQLIMRDPSLNFRVLDLTSGDPFSNARPSFFFKSIGGYHSAKLKRFQEVLDKQFSGAINEDVLDMLNTKYLITNSGDGGQSQSIKNRSTACGNAWFVPRITYVKNADQEMAAINSFDPRKEAFVEEKFKPVIDSLKLGYDPNAMIKLTDYHPDHLTYEYSTGKDMFAVFAEVWYDKGWKAYVDNSEIPLIRANYILRAAQLPGGNHKVELKFEPASYYKGELISLIASLLLVSALAFAVYTEVKRK